MINWMEKTIRLYYYWAKLEGDEKKFHTFVMLYT